MAPPGQELRKARAVPGYHLVTQLRGTARPWRLATASWWSFRSASAVRARVVHPASRQAEKEPLDGLLALGTA